VNASGSVVGAYSYDAYGLVSENSGSATTSIGFAEGYTDETTGLLYLVHRYYDLSSGQFLSVDPKLSLTNQPYAYTNDDPLNGTDPTGLYTHGYCVELSASIGGAGVNTMGCLLMDSLGEYGIGWSASASINPSGFSLASLLTQGVASATAILVAFNTDAGNIWDLRGSWSAKGAEVGIGHFTGEFAYVCEGLITGDIYGFGYGTGIGLPVTAGPVEGFAFHVIPLPTNSPVDFPLQSIVKGAIGFVNGIFGAFVPWGSGDGEYGSPPGEW
jgi:RHS repeat-associated protein